MHALPDFASGLIACLLFGAQPWRLCCLRLPLTCLLACAQEFLQDFSWTQAALPADLQLRNQRLSDSETPSAKPEAPRGPGLRRAGVS